MDRFCTSDSALAAWLWAFHAPHVRTELRDNRCFFWFDLSPARGRELDQQFLSSEFKRYEEFRRRILGEVHLARRQTDAT